MPGLFQEMRPLGRTFAKALGLATILLAFAVSSGGATTAHPAHPLGVVPHAGASPSARALAPAGAASSQDVSYHNGSVMRTNTTYAIYWVPSGYHVASNYESAIDGYFEDVAAASGTSDNVFSTDAQYYDTTGSIAYASTFGGSYVDTKAFPASGCDDRTPQACLTDLQLQTEIQRVISLEKWPDGQTRLFVLLLPDNLGVCWDSSGRDCTTTDFCAYHSDFYGTDGDPVIYAVQPYAATIPGCNPTPGGAPNGDVVDSALNTISHEQNEAITDPEGDAWYNADGEEIGDICAWHFGDPIGVTSGGQPYNQLINGHPYSLQEEWSNDGSSCVERYGGGLTLPVNLAAPVVSGTAAVGRTLTTSTGTWTAAPTAYTYGWQRCDTSGGSCAAIAGATSATYKLAAADVGHTVRSEVSATNGAGSATAALAAPSKTVVPLPLTTSLPVISGKAAVGKTISTTSGSWNTPAVSFSYRWLRCAANGSACTRIAGATHRRYVLELADAGHVLESRVSGENGAGTVTATSAPTAVVIRRPVARSVPRISGRATKGIRLASLTGAWRWSPTSFRYQWLRCSAQGTSCVRIPGATHSTYVVTKADSGHRLRLRVTAVNLAGRTGSESAPTRVVPS